MTADEFLERLAATRDGWTIYGGRIRWPDKTAVALESQGAVKDVPKDAEWFCPITAVCFEQTGVCLSVADISEAAKLLGLDRELADTIARFADTGLPGDSLRQRLEAATINRGAA